MKVLNCYILEISVEICKLYFSSYCFFFEIFDGVAIKQNNNNNNTFGLETEVIKQCYKNGSSKREKNKKP